MTPILAKTRGLRVDRAGSGGTQPGSATHFAAEVIDNPGHSPYQGMDVHFQMVRFALALHLDASPAQVELHHRLDRDLGLDPLDLVLVVLRLEEIENAEFPVGDLEHVATVEDLVDVVRQWSSPDRCATLPPPPPARTQSGMRPVATPVIGFEPRRVASR